MYNYQQQESVPVGIPVVPGYPLIQEEYKAPSYPQQMYPNNNYMNYGYSLPPSTYHQVSQNTGLIAQPQLYPQFQNNTVEAKPQPYVSKFQKLAQMLNDENPQSNVQVKKIKDPKDMTATDHLEVQIEAQNEMIKEKQKQMLNFIQPKTISKNVLKPSIEADIPFGSSTPGQTPTGGANYLIHKVNPNETLDRICLIYNVSKHIIQRANDFTGDEIYMKKELIIPNSNGPIYRVESNPELDEQKRRRDMIELMSHHIYKNSKTQQTSFKAEAQYYLEVANYDFNQAIKEFEEDLKFEREQEQKFGAQKGNKKRGMKPLIYLQK